MEAQGSFSGSEDPYTAIRAVPRSADYGRDALLLKCKRRLPDIKITALLSASTSRRENQDASISTLKWFLGSAKQEENIIPAPWKKAVYARAFHKEARNRKEKIVYKEE